MLPSPDPSAAPPPSSGPRFDGRVALVTGAGRGIGRAIAFGLAREGCSLILCDICEGLPDGTPYPKTTKAEFGDLVDELTGLGTGIFARVGDAADLAFLKTLVDSGREDLGQPDFLVLNAAATLEGPIAKLDPRKFEIILRNNLVAAFNALHLTLPLLAKSNRGRVVLIGSGDSKHAEQNAAPYVASKWGLLGLAKTAALEAAKSRTTVNVVLPGPVDTPMMSSQERFRQYVPDKQQPTRKDYLEARRDATPMGLAWVKPEDVANTVLFLLSEEARFISGSTVSVDAADSAHWN